MLAAFNLSHTVRDVRSTKPGAKNLHPQPVASFALSSRFDSGPRCFLPASSSRTILVSLPPSPLASGLGQVFSALEVPYTECPSPTSGDLESASLWVCDDLVFASAASIPRTLRVVVFTAEYASTTSNVEALPPTAPTSRLLDLASAWANLEISTLSQREREILSLVSRGLSNEEIAATCFVSTATVKTHLLRSFRKLGVSDRAAAVYKAVKMGLIV